MSKRCENCKGKGRWQVRERYSDGDEVVYWQECGNCNGSGVDQDPETGQDWDIGGDSYAEED